MYCKINEINSTGIDVLKIYFCVSNSDVSIGDTERWARKRRQRPSILTV